MGTLDLLTVITNWGPYDCGNMTSSPGGGGGIPTSISDCYNVFCNGLSGEEWQNCINKCIESVCEENPSECD